MILVTGGAGYIGGITAAELLRLGRDVCVYDNLSRGHRDTVPDGAIFREANLGDTEALKRVFAELPIEAVMHFAGYALVGESMSDPALYFNNNVCNGLNLLNAAQEAGVSRFIFSSTCAIFADVDLEPLNETSPLGPDNPYGESKLIFEKTLEWYRKIHQMEVFSLRYFNACGADGSRGERHDPETHLIPLVLDAADGRRERIAIHGNDYPTADGTCIRDYIDVRDLADAHIAALDAAADAAGHYNLGSGTGYSVREVIATVERVTGFRVPVTVGPRRAGDPPIRIADPKLANEKLGWQAKRTLEDSVRSAWLFMQGSAS